LVHVLGEKKATILKQYLRPLRKEQRHATETEAQHPSQ
jgi:hypothetical protein